jgi:lipopolysaccharide export LptBFGC system permease protein LptF
MKTYHRHLIGQWFYNFSLAFLILNLLLLIGNMVRYGSSVGLANILPLLPALLPSMLIYSIPMAALTSTVSTLSRARQLCEPITLASSGVGLFQLLPPFLMIGLILNVCTAISFQWLQPMGDTYKKNYLSNIGAKMLRSELKKPQSTLQIGSDTLSFFDRENGQRSALIQHRNEQKIAQELFSNHAQLEILEDLKKIRITTFGKLHVTNYVKGNIEHLAWTDFPPLELAYPEKYSKNTSPKQWSLTHMWNRILNPLPSDDLHLLKAYFFEKISLTMSPLLLILAAFPLGFLGKDSGRLTGFLLGLGLIFLVYYPLSIMSKNLAINEGLPPVLVLQIPNFALLIIGLWGLKRLDARI